MTTETDTAPSQADVSQSQHTETEAYHQDGTPLSLEDLYRAGVHLGHLSKRWNPGMKDYILLKHNRRHVLDMRKTLKALEDAKDAVKEVVAQGGECLLVGTRPQARGEVERIAQQVGAMYITSRWLGGTLTNFATISRRIASLIQLEEDFAKDEVQAHTKRELLMKQAEVKRLNKFFGGIKEMSKLPDILFVVGVDRERHAVKEATDLNIPVVAIVDTNCDPSKVTHPIPGNDDSHSSVKLICEQIGEAIAEGKQIAIRREQERQAALAEREAQEAAMAAARAAAARRAQESSGQRQQPAEQSSDNDGR